MIEQVNVEKFVVEFNGLARDEFGEVNYKECAELMRSHGVEDHEMENFCVLLDELGFNTGLMILVVMLDNMPNAS